jgi:uncharacterized membrane protein YidH (DUF202 family)
MLALTAAFTPMVAIAAFPVAAAVAVAASIVANLTARWAGVVVLVVAAVALGYGTARWAANYDDTPASSGVRRWLPLAATVVVVGCCVTEIVSGSRAPDPVIPLWFASAVWVYAFLPIAVGVWGPARRTLWAVGPLVTFIAILFVWTQGFFSLRFDRALSDLDAIAQQVADGDHVPANTRAGGFIVHHVDSGFIARSTECDVGFWITGWHQEDTRYIAHCIGHPTGSDVMHLAGDWWQVTDKQAPSNL